MLETYRLQHVLQELINGFSSPGDTLETNMVPKDLLIFL